MKKTLSIFFAALIVNFNLYSQHPEELSLPAIPSELRDIPLRAGFLIEHFWDNLDFKNDSRINDMPFLEQNFANFVNVFPPASEQSRLIAVDTLMHRASINPNLYKSFIDIAEKYLYELESPVANDDTYALFLNNIISSPYLDDIHKLRYKAQLEAVTKNHPGLIAADFDFFKPDNSLSSLYKTNTNPPSDLILIFYDPTCEHCLEVIAEMRQSDLIRKKITDGNLNVLALFSGEDKDLWLANLGYLDQKWIAGYDDGTLQDEGLYILRTMPTIYLLDSSKRVILKEPSLEKLLSALNELE